ncbi:MAG: DUF5114 domain-containing protein [Breznakibacter sp.]
MNYIKSYIIGLSCLFAITACEKEGDKMILSGLEASQLTTTETDVVLNTDNHSSLVLSLVWNSSTLTVSDQSVGIPSGFPIVMLQASATSGFETVAESQKTVTSQAYTGSELNTLAKNLGLTPDVASPLYFRIQSKFGPNTDPVYSNTVSVNVTPYLIDMSILYVLDKDQAQTLATLYSPASDGEYTGFMAATSWMNLYFREGDGTTWGNDGVSGTAFVLSNDASTMWNGWFPGNGGCYWITMSTSDKAWTATLLPEISVSGDVSASLAFSTSLKLWSGVITTTSDNAKIRLSSAAKLYNSTTGTDDAAAVATTIHFAESQSGVLDMAGAAGDINVPAAGTYTLKIDLTDPTQWTYTLTPGEDTPEEEDIPYLYLAGIDDAVTGPNWNFDVSIPKLSNGTYAGVAYANSLWGYRMYVAASWGDYYTLGSSESSLVKNGDGNIPVSGEGTFLISANLSALTYSMTELGDKVFLSGLNDTWDFNTTLDKTGEGTYTGTITVTAKSAWGFKIYIESDNWNYFFGGANGTLYYQGDGITDDATPGTYTLSIDLINMTYQMTLNQ